MRVIQISDSQLGTWYDCQLRYYYEKERRFHLIGDKPSYFQDGSVIHKFLEIFYRLGIRVEGKPTLSYSDRIEAALVGGVDYANLDDSITLSGERLQFLKDTFFQYADFWKEDAWVPHAVEQPFTMELFRSEDEEGQEGIQVLYEGIVDLIVEIPNEEGLIPVDHKSSSSFKKYRHPSLLSGQFMGYAVATDATKVIENKIGFQTSYTPREKFIRVPISFDAAVMEEWKGWTVVQALKIDRASQEGYFEPNYNSCKRGCPFVSICYTRPSIREWKLNKDYIIAPPRSGKGIYKNTTE